MTAGTRIAVSLCNPGTTELLIWLEPWTGEFRVPPRSELVLDCSADDPAVDPTPDLEVVDDSVVVYGAGGSRVAVLIDGVDQQSFSAKLACPNMGSLTPRKFVDVVFGDHPEARPHGLPRPPAEHRSRGGWLALLLGRNQVR